MALSIIILAILQGLAEFLPISSSGHLVLGKTLLNIDFSSMSGATMEVFLHFGTLIAIIIYYRKKIWSMTRILVMGKFSEPDSREPLFVLWASIPAGVFGTVFGDFLESLFSAPRIAAIMLMITGVFLLSTKLIKQTRNKKLNLLNTMIIGFAQAFAILPGISRSGATITAALWLGIEPERAAEFSFILAIPALLGATIIKALDCIKSDVLFNPMLLVGIIISAVVGYAALAILIPIIRKGKFWAFGIYCIAIGVAAVCIV